MNLKNKILRRLAEKEWIVWRPDYYTEAEKILQERYDEQMEKLEKGEELNPPWVVYNPDMSPWELRHDYWLINYWLPFWRNLNEKQRQAYREKWKMPEEWYFVVSTFWTDIGNYQSNKDAK